MTFVFGVSAVFVLTVSAHLRVESTDAHKRSDSLSVPLSPEGEPGERTEAEGSTDCGNVSKTFVYLIQGEVRKEIPGLRTSCARDLVWLAWKKQSQEALFLPNSTWSQGRMALIEEAIGRVASGGGSLDYMYYIEMDSDVRPEINSEIYKKYLAAKGGMMAKGGMVAKLTREVANLTSNFPREAAWLAFEQALLATQPALGHMHRWELS